MKEGVKMPINLYSIREIEQASGVSSSVISTALGTKNVEYSIFEDTGGTEWYRIEDVVKVVSEYISGITERSRCEYELWKDRDKKFSEFTTRFIGKE